MQRAVIDHVRAFPATMIHQSVPRNCAPHTDIDCGTFAIDLVLLGLHAWHIDRCIMIYQRQVHQFWSKKSCHPAPSTKTAYLDLALAVAALHLLGPVSSTAYKHVFSPLPALSGICTIPRTFLPSQSSWLMLLRLSAISMARPEQRRRPWSQVSSPHQVKCPISSTLLPRHTGCMSRCQSVWPWAHRLFGYDCTQHSSFSRIRAGQSVRSSGSIHAIVIKTLHRYLARGVGVFSWILHIGLFRRPVWRWSSSVECPSG